MKVSTLCPNCNKPKSECEKRHCKRCKRTNRVCKAHYSVAYDSGYDTHIIACQRIQVEKLQATVKALVNVADVARHVVSEIDADAFSFPRESSFNSERLMTLRKLLVSPPVRAAFKNS